MTKKKAPTGKQIKVSDKAEDNGIYYRTDSKGAKTFYINYRHYGKAKWEKIGREIDGFTVPYARHVRIDRVHAVQTGAASQNPNITMRQAWERYHRLMVNAQFRSLKPEEARYNKHIKPKLGHLPLAKITTEDLTQLEEELNAKGLAPSYISNIISQVGRIFNKMGKLKAYRGLNPVKDLDRKNTQVQRLRFLTEKEGEALLVAAKDIDLTLYRQCAISFYSGMRANEVLQLCLDKVNIKGQEMRVKTKHSKKANKERIVPMEDELVPILKEILAEKDWEPIEKFFPRKQINLRKFQQAVNVVGLNDGYSPKDRSTWITFHSLRHSFGSLAASYGTPLRILMGLMGHETIAATQRYTHVTEGMLHESSRMISEARRKALEKIRRA